MGVFFDTSELPAPVASLADAQREITRLLKQMLQTNEKYANLRVKAEQDRRSLAGQIRVKEDEIAELREVITQLRSENHDLRKAAVVSQAEESV